MHKNHPRKILTREEYTLRAIEGVFPSGEWVEDKAGRSGTSQVAPGEPEGDARTGDFPVSPSLTIIGGTKYDAECLFSYVATSGNAIVGTGRGVESDIAKWGGADGTVTVIPLQHDVYGKNARKVNVEQVLCFDISSPLLLVGSGERVKQAEAWLKRMNGGREVIRLP